MALDSGYFEHRRGLYVRFHGEKHQAETMRRGVSVYCTDIWPSICALHQRGTIITDDVVNDMAAALEYHMDASSGKGAAYD